MYLQSGREQDPMPPMLSILDELKRLDKGPKALRSFGWVVGGVLLGIAAVVVWRNGWTISPVATWLGGIGGALVVLGTLIPVVLRPVYMVWMGLALVLGFVMTRVVLTLVFYVVLTPTGLLLRAFGKDPMHRHPEPEAPSYWISRTDEDRPPERLERYY